MKQGRQVRKDLPSRSCFPLPTDLSSVEEYTMDARSCVRKARYSWSMHVSDHPVW